MARPNQAGQVNLRRDVSYAVAVAFWIVTAFYALLASQDFIYQQFLQPELFRPLAWFARYWPALATITGVCWFLPRGMRWHRPVFSTWLAAVGWLIAAVASWSGRSPIAIGPGPAALAWAAAAIALVVPLAVAERPDARPTVKWPRPNTATDFFACLLAGAVLVGIDAGVASASGASWTATDLVLQMWMIVRGPVLAAMTAFLWLTVIRSVAAFFDRPVIVEAAGSVIALGLLFGWFIGRVVLPSISIDSGWAALAAIAVGVVIAAALTVRAAHRYEYPDDGVASVITSLSPRFASRGGGFTLWVLTLAVVAFAVHRGTQALDWNAVAAHLGVVVVALLVLSGARRVVWLTRGGEPAVFFGVALSVLAVHAVIERVAAPDPALARTTISRWISDLLAVSPAGAVDLFELLPRHTNIPSTRAVAPVPVDWSRLDGEPAAERPDIYLFVIDSLRRDYLSPYNPAVTFTPAIDAFANDSLVFASAFTQYGATGLSVPSIWMGGPLLHKQYVEPFAPMNALARLLTHEQYTEWISMDNILDVILPATPALDPLDRQLAVRDFRMCRTLDEIRGRLRDRGAAAAPLFAYSLPQDIHVSTITSEGGRALDADRYDGFYAPVASRVRRIDACFGAFIDDLKARGRYDRSIVIVTSDHGDSLGEEGRFGHAYTLYPEIVRVPLLMHVPRRLRARFEWDMQRPSYTTDLTPTLYQLLGHQPVSPQPFFGESLAVLPGVARSPAPSRMVAASYGSVYGALLNGANRLYVADAIQRREMAFEIDSTAAPGTAVAVTAAMRRDGGEVIRTTVEAIAEQYRFNPPPR